MPILATDKITFHVEFNNALDPDTGLLRDAFECSMEKQLTSSYWDVKATDKYFRKEADGTLDDYNNSVELDG